jgi:DNA-binding HxlR family transcriptional regulator
VSAISRAGVSVARISNRSRRRPLRADLDLIERVDKTLDVLHGKWKVHLLFFMARGIHRHSRLLECTPGMSKKVMTDSLRALERDGLVQRRIFAEVPARVEYYITPLGLDGHRAADGARRLGRGARTRGDCGARSVPVR